MKSNSKFDKAIDFAMALALLSMVVVVFAQVFFRYALNFPLSWPEEFSRILIVWLSFIGGYIAMRENRHVGFNLLLEKLPGKLRAIVSMVAQVLVITFLFVFIKEGWGFAKTFADMPMPYTGIQTGKFVYSALPVSGLLMLLLCVRKLGNSWNDFKNLSSNVTANKEVINQ